MIERSPGAQNDRNPTGNFDRPFNPTPGLVAYARG